MAPKRLETLNKMWETIEQFVRKEPFHMMTGISFWRKAMNFIYYYFTFGGTLFKSQAKVDIEKQLRTMHVDEPTIQDIMGMIE